MKDRIKNRAGNCNTIHSYSQYLADFSLLSFSLQLSRFSPDELKLSFLAAFHSGEDALATLILSEWQGRKYDPEELQRAFEAIFGTRFEINQTDYELVGVK